jgi:type VI secretion system protein ImpH
MAGSNRRSSADLDRHQGTIIPSDLISNGSSYEYYQAIRLLHRLVRSPGLNRTGPADRIRVKPALNLAFPPADIDCIEAVEDEEGTSYHVTANFLGLYGSSSPLPTFYTEDLIAEAGQDESVSRDFLDIIHHRLYDLLYQGWLKYRQFFQVKEENSALYRERIFCLLGLGSKKLRREIPEAERLIRYIGLFTQFPRSALGLVTLLRDSLPDVPIDLVPCIKRMAKIPDNQRISMGMAACALGVESYVGEEIEDRMGKFRIQIGPLTQAGFLAFTPGSSDFKKLVSLIELYITEPFECELELILMAHQAQTVCLGDPVRSVLGVSSWVFSEPSLGEVRTRFAVN